MGTSVGMTISARARFSASGVWRARIAANFAGVIPGRASTRARWTSAFADTTTTRSTRASPPVSNNRGNVEHDERRGGVGGQEGGAFLTDGGVDDALQPLHRGVVTKHRRAERRAVDAGRTGAAREGGLDFRNETAARALQEVDGGVGIEHGDALGREHRGNGGLAHADRAGEAERQHGMFFLPSPFCAFEPP